MKAPGADMRAHLCVSSQSAAEVIIILYLIRKRSLIIVHHL